MKSKFFLILFVLFFLSFIKADCFPSYNCGEWSSCENDVIIRTCIDTKCGGEDIIERKFCGEADCNPDIRCGEWSNCNFFDKTNDLFKEQLIFEGSKERICSDKADCIDSFVEVEGCSLAVPIKVKKTEWCGQELVEIFDDKGNIVGRVQEKDSIKNYKRIDISLIEKILPTYCDYCFDREKNYDEEEIDCGGPSCPACIKDINFIDWAHFVSIFSWGIFGLLSLISFIILNKEKNFRELIKLLVNFFKPLTKEEALEREEKIKQFIFTKKINSEGYKNY